MGVRRGIILAYDKSTFDREDERLLIAVAPYVDVIKIGLQAMFAHSSSGFTIAHLVYRFVTDTLDKKIMWDAKLNDIPNTVGAAASEIVKMKNILFFTVHASAGIEALRAAAKACRGSDSWVLVVTVLTSLEEKECDSIFGATPGKKVVKFVVEAYQEAGITSFVSSPQDLRFLDGEISTSSLDLVTPGVRPTNAPSDDQKRVMTVGEAVRAGAGYIVIGRPIMKAPDPVAAAQAIRKEFDEAVASL
jgi:orotidine-5'-phosphate decarboxylase